MARLPSSLSEAGELLANLNSFLLGVEGIRWRYKVVPRSKEIHWLMDDLEFHTILKTENKYSSFIFFT